MHIGELAERTGLSLRTIRHYDDVGLLPATSRTGGGFRVYTEDDFERLMIIRRMKPLGFSLEQMAELLAVVGHAEPAPGHKAKLEEFLDEARAQREKLARNLEWADEFIGILEQNRAWTLSAESTPH